jgi:hypothetical protein
MTEEVNQRSAIVPGLTAVKRSHFESRSNAQTVGLEGRRDCTGGALNLRAPELG